MDPKMLERFFYGRTPEQKAFFALSLPGLLAWLAFSLLSGLWTLGIVRKFCGVRIHEAMPQYLYLIPAWVFAIFGIFAVSALFRLYRKRFTEAHPKHPDLLFWIFPLWAVLGLCLLPLTGGSLLSAAVLSGILMFLILLPMFCFAGDGAKYAACSAGFLTAGLISFRAVLEFALSPDSAAYGENRWLCTLVSGSACTIFAGHAGPLWGYAAAAAAGVIFLAAWYLSLAKAFSLSSELPMSWMFGRLVKILWIACGLCWAGVFCMACWVHAQADLARTELIVRYGRQISRPALEKLYYGGERANPGFWRKAGALASAADRLWERGGQRPNPDSPLTPAENAAFRKILSSPEIAELETMLSGRIPKWPREFGTESSGMEMPICILSDFEWITAWKIRFDLENGRKDSALRRHLSLTRACEVLRDSADPEGICFGIGGGERTALQLLESGALSAVQLDTLDREFSSAERIFPTLRDAAAFSKAVRQACILDAMEEGEDCTPAVFERFLLPQFDWHFAALKREIFISLNNSAAEDVRHVLIAPDQPAFAGMELKSLNAAFLELLARNRAVRTLIEAERARLASGNFPETLPALPDDPVTGKPLIYRTWKHRQNRTGTEYVLAAVLREDDGPELAVIRHPVSGTRNRK